MNNDFQTLVDKHRARMRHLAEVMERDGRLHAVSARDPTYSILLTKNGSSEAPWHVTSFRGRELVGHRQYDVLQGMGPTQNALQEFAGDDLRLVPKPMRKRDRDRKIKEANEGIAVCAEAITKTPDDAGKAIFLGDRMRTPRVGHGTKTSQAVTDDLALWIQAPFGEVRKRTIAKAADPDAASGAPACPSGVVSTAATNGVLPGAPRPRLPPERSPRANLCLIFQAVVCVTPRRRPSSMLEMPCLLWVR
jgi:hypothetical protein